MRNDLVPREKSKKRPGENRMRPNLAGSARCVSTPPVNRGKEELNEGQNAKWVWETLLVVTRHRVTAGTNADWMHYFR